MSVNKEEEIGLFMTDLAISDYGRRIIGAAQVQTSKPSPDKDEPPTWSIFYLVKHVKTAAIHRYLKQAVKGKQAPKRAKLLKRPVTGLGNAIWVQYVDHVYLTRSCKEFPLDPIPGYESLTEDERNRFITNATAVKAVIRVGHPTYGVICYASQSGGRRYHDLLMKRLKIAVDAPDGGIEDQLLLSGETGDATALKVPKEPVVAEDHRVLGRATFSFVEGTQRDWKVWYLYRGSSVPRWLSPENVPLHLRLQYPFWALHRIGTDYGHARADKEIGGVLFTGLLNLGQDAEHLGALEDALVDLVAQLRKTLGSRFSTQRAVADYEKKLVTEGSDVGTDRRAAVKGSLFGESSQAPTRNVKAGGNAGQEEDDDPDATESEDGEGQANTSLDDTDHYM